MVMGHQFDHKRKRQPLPDLRQFDPRKAARRIAVDNPEATDIALRLVMGGKDNGLDIYRLYELGITGALIVLAYRDYAGQDLVKLRTALRERDPALLRTVNERRAILECAVASL